MMTVGIVPYLDHLNKSGY